jgi:hypothetical protein
LVEASDKLSKFIADTFIFTQAQRDADAALKSENTTLAEMADRLKTDRRELQLMMAVSVSEKDKLKLGFKLEDLGGDPAALKKKLDDVTSDFSALSKVLNQPNRFAVPDGLKELGFSNEIPGRRVDDAKAKLVTLEREVAFLSASYQQALVDSATAAVQLAKDEAEARIVAQEQAARAFMRSLQDQLTAQKQTHLVSLQEELQFWQSKLAAAARYPEVYRTIQATIGNIDQQLFRQQESLNEKLERDSIAANEKAANEQVALAMKAAHDKIQAMLKARDEAIALRALDLQNAIETAKGEEQVTEQQAAQDLARGKITKQQKIQIVADAKVKELDQEIQYYQALQKLYADDEKKVKAIQLKITKDEQEQLKVRAKAEADTASATAQQWKKAMSGMENLFSSFTQNIISGHKSLAQSWANLVDGMASKFLEGIEKQILASIEGSIRQTAIHEQTAAAGNAIDQANSAKSGLRAAIDAAKGAWKWAANNDLLPFAPVIAAGAFAAVEAFGSAEGGQWEVPGQQWTLVHPKESIIPSYIASPMRAFFENGGNQISTAEAGHVSGGQGGSPVHVHFHVNAIDGADAASFIQKNANNITSVLYKQMRKKGFSVG